MDKEPGKPPSTWINDTVMGAAAQSASVEMLRVVLEQGGYGIAIENNEQQQKDAMFAIPVSLMNDETNWTCLETVIDCALPRDDTGAFIRSEDDGLIDNLQSAVCNCCGRVKLEELRKVLHLIMDATILTQESPKYQRIMARDIRHCYTSNTEPCATELLENWGATPNVNDMDDDEHPLPLGDSVTSGSVDWVRFWLEHGADTHRASGAYCNGPTALAFAARLQKDDIVRLLLDYGGPVDGMDDDLVGSNQIGIVVSGSEKNTVELTRPSVQYDSNSLAGREVFFLDFEGGVSADWLKRIEYRRLEGDLVNDGTSRPRKAHR